jgi:hypothetical protein
MVKLLKQAPYLLALMAFVFISCGNDDDGPGFTGESGIKGKINVQNQYQQPLYDERGGIAVFMEVGFREFEVVADNVGRWQLAGAPVGTYTITYSKPGYSTIVQRGISISNVTPNYPVDNQFQQLPTATITKLPLTDFDNFELDLSINEQGMPPDTSFTLNVTATMLPAPPPTGQAKGYRIFIGDNENVSPTDYIFQEHKATTSADIDLTYDNMWFDSLGFKSGDALYAALYGDANFNLEMANPMDSSLVFPNLCR